MKKFISFALVVIIALSALASCTGGSGSTTTTTQNPPAAANVAYVLNGEDVASVAKGNYVVYVREKNNSSKWVAWDYDAWTVKNAASDASYIAYMFSVDALYNSAEELEAATGLTAGMKVGTKSYHANLGRGAALYTVVGSKPATNGSVKISGSSAYAELTPFDVDGDKVVTVDQFGAYADGDKGDHVKITSAINFPTATLVEFEGSVYMQEKTITLEKDNVKIDGNGANITNRYDRVVVNVDFRVEGTADNRVENVVIENLTLTCTEADGAGALYNSADHYQFQAIYTDGLTVHACSFIAEYIDTGSNGPNRHITSVNLATGDNTVFDGNTIKNLCGSDTYSGGLWLTGSELSDGSYTESTNITITNNHIEKSSHDETFAFFLGDFTNVVVKNNTIYSHDEPKGQASAHAIGFGVHAIASTMTNVEFSGNTIDVVAWADAIVMADVVGMKIYDNEITLRYNSPDQPILYGVFRVAEPALRTQTGVEIYNNTVKAYNSYDIPLTFNCENGFDVHDNDYQCIIVTD